MLCQNNIGNEVRFCLVCMYTNIQENITKRLRQMKKKFIVFVTFENSKLNKKFLTDKKEVVTGNIFCKHIFLVKCK